MNFTNVNTYPYGPQSQQTIDTFETPKALVQYFGDTGGKLATGYTMNSTPPMYLAQPNTFIARKLENIFRDFDQMIWFNVVFPIYFTKYQKELNTELILNDYMAQPSGPGSPTVFTTTRLESRMSKQEWQGTGITLPFHFFKDEWGVRLYNYFMSAIPYSLVRSSIYILWQTVVASREPFLDWVVKDRSGVEVLQECSDRKRFFFNKVHRDRHWSLEQIREKLTEDEARAGLSKTTMMIAHPRVATVIRHMPENTKNDEVGQYKGNGQGGQNIPQAEMTITRVGSAQFVTQERCPLTGNESWQPTASIDGVGEHYLAPLPLNDSPYTHSSGKRDIAIFNSKKNAMHKFTIKDLFRNAIIQLNVLLNKSTTKVDLVKLTTDGTIGGIVFKSELNRKTVFEYGAKTFHNLLRIKSVLNQRGDINALRSFPANSVKFKPTTEMSAQKPKTNPATWLTSVLPLNFTGSAWTASNVIQLADTTCPYTHPDYLLFRSIAKSFDEVPQSYAHAQVMESICSNFEYLNGGRGLDAKYKLDGPLAACFSNVNDVELIISYAFEYADSFDVVTYKRAVTPIRWNVGFTIGGDIGKLTVANPAKAFKERIAALKEISQFTKMIDSYLGYVEMLWLNIHIADVEGKQGLHTEVFERMGDEGVETGLNVLLVRPNMLYETGNIFSVIPKGGSFMRTEGNMYVKQYEDLQAELFNFEIRKMQGAKITNANALSIARSVAALKHVCGEGVAPIKDIGSYFTATMNNIDEFKQMGDLAFFIVPAGVDHSFDIAYTTHVDYRECSILSYVGNLYKNIFSGGFDITQYIESIVDSGPKPVDQRNKIHNRISFPGPHQVRDEQGNWTHISGNSVWHVAKDGVNRERFGEDIILNVK